VHVVVVIAAWHVTTQREVVAGTSGSVPLPLRRLLGSPHSGSTTRLARVRVRGGCMCMSCVHVQPAVVCSCSVGWDAYTVWDIHSLGKVLI
jgi:hypothetical protein